MHRHLGHRYAAVASTLALVVALSGGTAYATGLIGSGDIKDGGVKRVDIAKGAVNSAKVGDGTLLKGDFKAGQLPAGPAGAPGPRGPAGPQGPAGPAGDAGIVAYGVVTATGAVLSDQSYNFTAANVQKGVNAGQYCIRGLPFTPRSVMVAPNLSVEAGGESDTVVSYAILAAGVPSPTGCTTPQVMVATYDAGYHESTNRGFVIWFQD